MARLQRYWRSAVAYLIVAGYGYLAFTVGWWVGVHR